ncbi:hypothetical protein PGT21_015727 [Puccinia graminis f. sp. tritici]|uniref:Uncharacterized protein n=1 Tax=Puccinia graminis f. sp. tritici TaxID=56615 RepID=A0A5B0PA42_PUCGR|nr:hypothetical protein PGT21_015727 [Puccinia graminis f. sp. tritici]
MYLRLVSSDHAWFAFPCPVTTCDRVQSVLGLALAPLRFGRSSSKPIIHPRRFSDSSTIWLSTILKLANYPSPQLSIGSRLAPQQVLRIELEFSD